MRKQTICMGCKKEIDIEKEKYAYHSDWNTCHKLEVESWWHIKCFKKAMNRDLTSLEKAAQVMLKKANQVYQHLPPEFTQSKKEFLIT